MLGELGRNGTCDWGAPFLHFNAGSTGEDHLTAVQGSNGSAYGSFIVLLFYQIVIFFFFL
jgi:hypothetical protein